MLDDDVSNTALLSNFLNRVGLKNTESINDPEGVFEKIALFQPDLILLDLAMPKLDGFQILELLRKEPDHHASIPVIVITGDATAANKRRALAAGVTDLLTKPLDPSETYMRIRNVLERRFLEMEIQKQNRLLDRRVVERTQQLQHALDDLQRAQRRMVQQERLSAFAEMAGGVVHDFSNALMAVIGYSDLLVAGEGEALDDRATALDYLRIINTAGRDAAEVVSRLRDYYRPRNNADLFQRVDLNEVVQQAIAMTQPKWKPAGRNSQIIVETELSAGAAVQGNCSELREMLSNLLFNAVDAMADGGLIKLSTSRLDGNVLVEVRDSGCGMTPEVRERCLDPFFTTKGDKGTGLGLPMVFGIVQRHQGRIDIETAPRVGTTFRITFPEHRAGCLAEAEAENCEALCA